MPGPHIVILVQNLPVPFDRRVWMESTTLRDAGFEVSVVSPAPADDPKACHINIDGIDVYRYVPPPPTQSKLSFIYEFYYCFRETRRLVKHIWKSRGFNVIHSCNPPDTFWAIARAYKRHGVKYVFDHHDLCPELYLSKFDRRDFFLRGLEWLERRQFKTADAIIATNQSYRQVAIERGGKRPEDVEVVRSGPRLSKFKKLAPDPALRRGREHLGVYLGVMGPQDGVDFGLRAVRAAIDAGLTNTSSTFIGSGDSFNDLVKLRDELKLNDYVEFTGRIPDDQLRALLSTADFGIAPDPKSPLNDVSTMNKIVEYMAMGLPIVSFDLKESKFSAEDAAIYVENNDTAEMGRQIIRLINDPALRERMSAIGMERARRELCWEISSERLVNFYRRVTDTRPVGAAVAGVVQ